MRISEQLFQIITIITHVGYVAENAGNQKATRDYRRWTISFSIQIRYMIFLFRNNEWPV